MARKVAYQPASLCRKTYFTMILLPPNFSEIVQCLSAVRMGTRQPPPPIIPPQALLANPMPGPVPLPKNVTPSPPPGPTSPLPAPPTPVQEPPLLPEGIRPLPPIANPILARPVAGTPKSGSDRSPPKPPPALLAVPPPALVPPPKPSSPKILAPPPPIPVPQQVVPSPGPGTPQNIASPVPQIGTPVGPLGRSAQNTPLGGTPAVSKRSVVQTVEFIPPTAYVDVSRVPIRFVQLLLLCELFFHLIGASTGMEFAELYFAFQNTFHFETAIAALVAPIALAIAALLTIRTIYGVFAINFTTPSGTSRSSHRLIALVLAHLIYGPTLILVGMMFKNAASGDETREFIKANLELIMRYATYNPRFMKEMNLLQQQFQCCGMKGSIKLNNTETPFKNEDHPWKLWFESYSLDETYPAAIRELYSLPWSCCNITSGAKCEHIGISRYQRHFNNPTDFNDVEAALHVPELNWNPTSYEHYLDRNELAIGTLYDLDCAEAFLRGIERNAESIEGLLFKAGIVVSAFSVPLVLVLIQLYRVLQSSTQPGTTPSARSK